MGSERRSTTATVVPKPVLPPGIPESAVRQQVECVRSSQHFKSSRRCVLFLDYVVQAALERHTDRLRERTVGVEVFGRDPQYDTNQDPIVRGTAGEVRKRLAQYYQIPGHERELRIELSPGSYTPEFHLAVETPPPVIQGETIPEKPVRTVHSNRRWGLKAAGILIAACLGGIALLLAHPQSKASAVDQFWAPLLQSSEPTLLCVGQPKVYNLLGKLETEVARRMPGPGHPLTGEAAEEKLTVPVNQFAPSWDRYIALGDAICLSDLVSLFAQKKHEYHIRGGGSTSFADLRENPAVLIGGFTNNWTMRLSGALRFRFELTPDGRVHYVYDRLHPTARKWQLTDVWPDWKMPVDYAIVSRVVDPTTGKMVVTAAGITHYGTAAAGEFLTNADELAQAIRQGPRDWQRKNVQVVLSTKVIGNTAGPPEVLATYFW